MIREHCGQTDCGMAYYAVIVFGLGSDFSLKSGGSYCEDRSKTGRHRHSYM